MRERKFNTKLVRKILGIFLCVVLMTTSTTAMLKTTSRQSEFDTKSDESTLHINNLAQTLDETNECIKYSFLFNEPSFKTVKLHDSKYTKITMPGTIDVGKKAGAPVMPVKNVKLLLPSNKEVKSINVIGESKKIQLMDINLRQTPLIPYQKPIPMGSKIPKEIDFDNVLYSSNNCFPEKIYDDYTIGYCRGYTILSVDLNPVQYVPDEGKLVYYPEMLISIELKETDEINQFYRNENSDEEWVKSLVYNPEITETYKDPGFSPLDYPGGLCDPIDDYDYVIITTTQGGLDHWSTSISTPYNWTSLIYKHEIQDGLNCTLVTIEDINACIDYHGSDSPVDDLPACIREFCRDAYQDWGTDYIFIGGDDEWIPAREMDYEYEGDVDSDIYWSNLDFTFNADSDSFWGEEGDVGFDLFAELFIGRITCDVPQDVSNWMKKSFYYADSLFQDYLDNAAFYGGALGWNCGGDDFIEYGAIKGTDDWLGPIPGEHGPYPSWLGFQYGFETFNSENPGLEYDLSVKWTAEYPPNPGWQGGSESSAITGLRNAINNDQCTLISAVAHADAHMSMDVYDTTWESQYHNTMPFFLHDFGCHCGDMDAADDGVLHSMLFHSDTELAFACIYNTCYGWGSFDDTNSSSALLMKSTWDYFFDITNNSQGFHNWQLGKAMAWAKDNMAPTIDWTYSGAPGSWRGVIEGCLLFGDPAQKIKPPILPDHNVGVQSLDVPSHVTPDQPVQVDTTIVNNGENDEVNVLVSFRVNGIEIDNDTIPFIASQTTEEVSFTWTPSLGWYTVTANVTIPGVTEDYYYDNEKSTIVIAGPDIAVTNLEAPSYAAIGVTTDISGTIENLGTTDESIDVYLKINGTIEDSQSIYLDSGTSTIVTFSWEPSIVGMYPVAIFAEITGMEPYLDNNEMSKDVQVFEAQGYVLLVDDDEGDSYETYFESALFASGYLYDVWTRNSQGSPSASTMSNYNAVIWFTGDDYTTTLDSTDQSNLANYLNNGGSLFITGQDIGYDIGSSSFYQNYLHANYLTDDVDIFTLNGIAGDPIGDGLTIGIASGDGANNQIWPSGISPRTQATSVFRYQSSSYDGGIKTDTGTYRVVYFSFGYEAINNFNDRLLVMGRTLGWLIGNYTTPDIWIDPTMFDLVVAPDETVYETLTIGNEADATAELSFDLEIPHGWTLQWDHTYGGMGHSQLAQPVGDIDEDGINEVIVGGYASYTAIILSYNSITGNYDQEHEWSQGGGTPSGACVIDLDDDGDLEFAVSWEYGYSDAVYAYDWDGSTLTTLDSYSGTGYDFCFDVYACDYDDDNDEEVLIANYPGYSGGYHVTALRWDNINDQFVHELSWGSGSSEECPMVWSGDTDNDGSTEVVAAVGPSTVYALNYMGSSWSPTVVASGLPSYPYGIAVGDLDGDGIDEIGIGTEYTQAYIYDWNGATYQQVWYNNYAGEYDIIEATAIDDADNDGQNEFIVGTDDIHVISYTGSGYSEESTILYTDGQLAGAIIADCDTDGLNEIKACDIIDGPGEEWIIEYEPEPTWLSVYPDTGNVDIGNSMGINVIINATGLTSGQYSSSIIIYSNDLDENPLVVPIDISVESVVRIEGYCYYENMTPVNNVIVEITNMNTSSKWQADTVDNYYSLALAPGVEIDVGDTLQLIAMDDTHYVNVTGHIVTSSDISSGLINLDLILDEYCLDLTDFPMYEAEDNNPTYTVNQLTGSAVAQMNLDYMWWNSSTYSDPPTWSENNGWDQTNLFNYGQENNSNTSLPYMDATGMWHTIQTLDPEPYSEYGYNFGIYHNVDSDIMLAQICQWIDYPAGIKPGYPVHVPGAIPAYGNYGNWLSVRGIHMNQTAYPLPSALDVFGFWVNDPYPSSLGGLGENSYKTSNEWTDTYYQPISIVDDPYNGEYIAICEPPMEGDCDLTLVPSPERWEPLDEPLGERKDGMMAFFLRQVSDNTVVQAAIDGVTDQLIPYDPDFEEMFKQSYAGRPMLIKNLREEKDDYYAVPFTNVPTTQPIKMGSHEDIDEVITMVVVLVDANDGHFKEASWVQEPVKYLPISDTDALDLVFDELIDMGINPEELNTREIKTDLVYRDSTPYYPDWRVIISELGLEFFVSQEGIVS